MLYAYRIKYYILGNKAEKGAPAEVAFKSLDDVKEWIRQNKQRKDIAWGIFQIYHNDKKFNWMELI